jgi:hypothetical protein
MINVHSHLHTGVSADNAPSAWDTRYLPLAIFRAAAVVVLLPTLFNEHCWFTCVM